MPLGLSLLGMCCDGRFVGECCDLVLSAAEMLIMATFAILNPYVSHARGHAAVRLCSTRDTKGPQKITFYSIDSDICAKFQGKSFTQ